jgi:7-cyano-7-deazaguanine synthase in queuosine biosynthesis
MVKKFHIAAMTTDRVLITGDASQAVKVDADGFFKRLLNLPPPRCIDLLQIAAASYAIDRITKRSFVGANELGYRRFLLVVEVRDYEFWRQAGVGDAVSEILRFLTTDDWQFKFVARREASASDGHQHVLDLTKDFRPKFGALYSGGLDSAAGMANRFLDGANDFVLVTVGHQSSLHKQVTRQLNELSTILKSQTGIEPNFRHSTLNIALNGGKAKRLRMQEKSQRSRAFLFCAAAAIAAKAYKLESMEVFENGVGAINLPLMSGMLGTCLSTRGAHPTFMRLMSDFCTQVTGQRILFNLPFLSATKADMLQRFRGNDQLITWAQSTRSCVHSAIRVTGNPQCGVCPACIERRQAFLSADLPEDIESYLADIFENEPRDSDEADYFRALRRNAKEWIEGVPRTRNRMTDHLSLTNVPTDQFGLITDLQMRHSRQLLNILGREAPRSAAVETKLLASQLSEQVGGDL